MDAQLNTISYPIVHPLQDVTVRVDSDVLTWWAEHGLSMQWHYSPEGPRFKGPEGTMQKVADVILGEPAVFVNGSMFDLTRANLRPAQPKFPQSWHK